MELEISGCDMSDHVLTVLTDHAIAPNTANV